MRRGHVSPEPNAWGSSTKRTTNDGIEERDSHRFLCRARNPGMRSECRSGQIGLQRRNADEQNATRNAPLRAERGTPMASRWRFHGGKSLFDHGLQPGRDRPLPGYPKRHSRDARYRPGGPPGMLRPPWRSQSDARPAREIRCEARHSDRAGSGHSDLPRVDPLLPQPTAARIGGQPRAAGPQAPRPGPGAGDLASRLRLEP